MEAIKQDVSKDMAVHMALETESRCILFDLLTQFLEQNLESRGSSHF